MKANPLRSPAPEPGAGWPADDERRVEITLAGERVHLLCERALWWPARGLLIVADLHLGKAAAFGAAGIPVPAGGARADLARLSGAISATGASGVAVLGDLLHARTGRDRATLDELARWRSEHARVRVLLVRGNHDDRAGDPPPELGFEVVDEPHQQGPFVLAHYPPSGPPGPGRLRGGGGGAGAEGHVLCGHVHPAITLRGPGGLRERAPCFVVGGGRTILPAFGSFTGSAGASLEARDRVFMVSPSAVLEIAARPDKSGVSSWG